MVEIVCGVGNAHENRVTEKEVSEYVHGTPEAWHVARAG